MFFVKQVFPFPSTCHYYSTKLQKIQDCYFLYKEICNELILGNEELQGNIEKNLNNLVEIITNSVKQSTLYKIFILNI